MRSAVGMVEIRVGHIRSLPWAVNRTRSPDISPSNPPLILPIVFSDFWIEDRKRLVTVDVHSPKCCSGQPAVAYGLEPPARGLGILGTVLIGVEYFRPYYIFQQLTTWGSWIVCTRFEPI
jgi:hypothetical protein